jgi:hypothetical protein
MENPAPAVALTLFICLSAAAAPRSAAERAAFQRENPCPSTGLRRGSCPNFVIDHVQPLCAGGPDHRSNMNWQTIAEALVKDRQEWRLCRALRAKRAIDRRANQPDVAPAP